MSNVHDSNSGFSRAMSYKIVPYVDARPHNDADISKGVHNTPKRRGSHANPNKGRPMMRAVLNAAPMPTPYDDGGL